jgi:hypothetical protein
MKVSVRQSIFSFFFILFSFNVAYAQNESQNLLDYVPEAKNITFLGTFRLLSVTQDDAQISITGKVNATQLTVIKDKKKEKSFSIIGKKVALHDFFKDASHIPLINRSTFDKITIDQDLITVDANFNAIAYEVQTTRTQQKNFSIKSNDITLAMLDSVIANDFSFLKSVAIRELRFESQWIEATFALGKTQMKLAKQKGTNNPLLFYTHALSSGSFIPSAKNSPADSLEFQELFLLYNPSQTELILQSFPKDLSTIAPQNKRLKHGLNIFANVDVKSSKGLQKVLRTFGVDALKLPLEGTLSKDTFAFMHKNANNVADANSKKSLLQDMDMQMPLPKFSLPDMSAISSIHAPKLRLGQNDMLGTFNRFATNSQKQKPKSQDPDGASLFFEFGAKLPLPELNIPLAASVHVENMDAKLFSVIVSLENEWKNPFSIKEVTVHKGVFEFKAAKESKEIIFMADADIHTQKHLFVSADITKQDNKFDLAFFDVKGKFRLDSFASKIPHADKFELDEVKIARDGLEAKTVLGGKNVDGFLFKPDTQSDVFAIIQKDFKITEVLPKSAQNKLLSQIRLSKAALIFSNKGLDSQTQGASIIEKDMFEDIFGKSNIKFKVDSGIALIAPFDADNMGQIGKGLKQIGVHDDAVIVGEILGVFGGTSGFDLELLMQKHNQPTLLPHKAMHFSDTNPPSFFFRWQGEDIDVGADVGMNVKAGKDRLFFHSTLELEFTEKGVGLAIMGAMDGTWHKPFGIEILSLTDLKLKVGVNDIGEVKIGFAGKEKIGSEVIDIATEVDILLEDMLPDGIAFSGTINKLGIDELVSITEALLKAPKQLSNVPLPFFEVHDVLLAYATPGATDPQLGLVSEGFAFSGEFFFLNNRLGKVFGSGGPKGVAIQGDIQDFNLDIVAFKNNNLDIQINENPKMHINSTVKLLEISQKIKVDFAPPHFEFEVVEKLAQFGFADLDIRMDGVDLQTGKFDKNADISIVGEFQSTLVPWMKGEIHKGLQELHDLATQKLEDDKKALDSALQKVAQIDLKIQKLKSQDDKAKKRAQESLNKAKSRVDSLKSKYDHAKYMSKHCGNRWTHWACKGYWVVEADAIWVSYKVAQGVLDAAKKAVAAAYDIDPRIIELKGEKDIATAALILAKAVVEVSEKAEEFVLKELDKIVSDALNNLPFEIEQAIILGDLKDMIHNDDPLILDLKFKILGEQNREYFAIKLKDPAFDAVSFALLPVMMLDSITESVLKKVDPKIAQWLHAHLATGLANAEEKVRKAVEKEEAKYKDILLSFENGSKKFKQAYEDNDEDKHDFIVASQLSDFMPQSKTFHDTYLAVGHSQLCLGVAKNGLDVIQEDCKDIEAERWSTASLDEGYVQLKSKGLCLKARNKDAKEGQPLVLAQCDKNDEHEQWKIISDDGFYDKIINKYSQKCLHFDIENANPNTAFAVWTSCIGADSQMFREIDTTKRPTWHDVKKEVAAKNGSCLAASERFESYFDLKGRYGHEHISDVNHDRMQQAFDDVLYSASCQSDETEIFNYVEALNGDIKLVHAKSGWCVVPKHDIKNSLILTPCDDGKDMWWYNKREGNAFALFNKYINKCIDLGGLNAQTKRGVAKLGICDTKSSAQAIDFIQ